MKNTSLNNRNNTLFSSVDLVLVPVTVSDFGGRPMLGLNKDNFQIFDNKKLQSIEQFSGEDIPTSIVVILDTSGSMAEADKLEKARQAVLAFLETCNPQDEVAMITVADKPKLSVDFTDSLATIQKAMISTAAGGATALLDAVYLAINDMKNSKYSKKALLIVSDGGDNHSRYKEREVTELIKESDLIIYTIGVFDESVAAGQDYFSVIYDEAFPSEEERLGPFLLSSMSEITGGRSFTINNPDDMVEIASKISLELRNQYVLGYHAQSLPHNGKWHNLKVKLVTSQRHPHLRVTAKQGYYDASH
ncbi:MAG TPA: VWA domain-containing protein [Terriglobales bacterium]|nr:VWA domain-containing protein [Terriglobales bacterium]